MITDPQIAYHLRASDRAMRAGQLNRMRVEFDRAMALIRARRQASDLPTAAAALVAAAKAALSANTPDTLATLASATQATESTLAHV
jgi:hypothetical protein